MKILVGADNIGNVLVHGVFLVDDVGVSVPFAGDGTHRRGSRVLRHLFLRVSSRARGRSESDPTLRKSFSHSVLGRHCHGSQHRSHDLIWSYRCSERSIDRQVHGLQIPLLKSISYLHLYSHILMCKSKILATFHHQCFLDY